MFIKYPNWVVALIETFVKKGVKFDIKYDTSCETVCFSFFPGDFT